MQAKKKADAYLYEMYISSVNFWQQKNHVLSERKSCRTNKLKPQTRLNSLKTTTTITVVNKWYIINNVK